MHRLERHYHIKSVSEALYTTKWRSVCRKSDVKQCRLQFPAERRQWLDFPDRSWKGIPGTGRSKRKCAVTNGNRRSGVVFLFSNFCILPHI